MSGFRSSGAIREPDMCQQRPFGRTLISPCQTGCFKERAIRNHDVIRFGRCRILKRKLFHPSTFFECKHASTTRLNIKLQPPVKRCHRSRERQQIVWCISKRLEVIVANSLQIFENGRGSTRLITADLFGSPGISQNKTWDGVTAEEQPDFESAIAAPARSASK